MARFGLVGPSYSSQSPNADAEETINLYVEAIEAPEGRSKWVLYPAPGLKTRWGLDAPVRGLFAQNGRLFAMAKEKLWELFADYSKIERGPVANDGQTVSWAAGQTQLLVCSAGALYVFDFALSTLAPIAGPDDPQNVAQVEYLHGYFLALLKKSNIVRFSALGDASLWDPADILEVSLFPDNVLALLVDHNELWLMGAKRSVPYYDSGDADNPLQPVTQGVTEQGIYPPRAISRFDNSFAWLGGDERGNLIAWRAQGYQPVRISNHAVENIWQGYARADDAVSYSYQDRGHTFWVIYFPTAKATWVYDAATGMWHRRAWWDTETGTSWAHRSWVHAFAFGKHFVGDWASGKVYELAIARPNGAGAWDFVDDDGNPLRRLRRATHLANEDELLFHAELQIILETGLGPIPPLKGAPAEGVTLVTLADSNGQLWAVTVDEDGVVHTETTTQGPAQTLRVGDPVRTFDLTVDQNGILHTTETAFDPATDEFLNLVDEMGNAWGLGEVLGGVLQTSGPLFQPRAPELMMRFSDDGGHTWSNEYRVGCGKAGEYRARAIFRRLGKSRDRVYEISMTDPIPWRIIDGLVKVS